VSDGSYGSTTFFTQVVTTDDLLGLSGGYEAEKFRSQRLAELMFNALPEFALSYSELQSLDPKNVVERLREALGTVYRTEKFKNRGEFGELLLHLVITDYFKTIPAISKLYYKDSANTTVKGFDAVHVVVTAKGLELWLGETKFYKDIGDAIRDVVAELKAHTDLSFMRDELLFIQRKLDPSWPYTEKLKALTDKNIPIDKIFDSLKIPVLLTYESGTVAKHKSETGEYLSELKAEVEKYHDKFRASGIPDKLTFVLILIPLHTKEELVSILDQKLKGAQSL
jgi:hypothetical protein